MHLLYDIKENEVKLNASTNTVVQLWVYWQYYKSFQVSVSNKIWEDL